MINEQIRDKEVRLIGENGEQLGIMSVREAMKLAEKAELDLRKLLRPQNHQYVRLSITVSIVMSWPEKKRSQKKTESGRTKRDSPVAEY